MAEQESDIIAEAKIIVRKAFLAQVPLLEGFSDQELDHIARFAREQILGRGGHFRNASEDWPGIYIVQSGEITVARLDEDLVCRRNDAFGMLTSTNFESIDVLSDRAELVFLNQDDLGRFLTDKPHLMRNFIDPITDK